MIVERRLAEFEWHRGRGHQRDTVGAEAGARRREDGRRGRTGGGDEGADLFRGDERHVAGDRDEDAGVGLRRVLLGQGHRDRVATILGLAEDLGAEGAGDAGDLDIARDHPDRVELGAAEGAEHVAQHRPRERRALVGSERLDQSLLGVDQVLDGHCAHDHGICRRGAFAGPPAPDVRADAPHSRMTRASATSCAWSVMMMSATTGTTLRSCTAGASVASRVSRTSASRQSRYAWTTPRGEMGRPRARISAPAGPLTGASPTIGLTPMTGARVSPSAATIPGTAKMGPMDVTGFDGQTTTRSAPAIASRTPGAGRASAAPA